MRKLFALPLIAVSCTLALSAKAQEQNKYLTSQLPAAWVYHSDHTPTMPGTDNWWTLFGDSKLDSLVSLAASRNYDIKEATIRRELARNAIGQARSAYWPELSVSAGYTRQHEGGKNSNQYTAGAQMNWEIDIFGKVASAVKSKKASYRASSAEFNGAMLSMAAEIATYYIDYRMLQSRIAIAEEHINSQEKVVRIAEARHEAGLVSKLDVAQAKTVLLNTKATLPQLRSQMRSTLTAIATLLGQYPDSISVDISGYSSLPAPHMLLPTGIPADLLRRRPDIIAAEAQLAAAAASVGIAKKDFLPTLSIQGEVGTVAARPGDLFGSGSLQYSIAPTLSWTIFDGLSRRYGVEQAKLQMQNAIDNYNLTVLTAVGEVDNAIVAYHTSVETLKINSELFKQSKEAFELSMDQYKQGLSAFTNVVDAQVDLLNSANAITTAKGNAILALINLYKALGGTPNP